MRLKGVFGDDVWWLLVKEREAIVRQIGLSCGVLFLSI
jgi:hypothetical protein